MAVHLCPSPGGVLNDVLPRLDETRGPDRDLMAFVAFQGFPSGSATNLGSGGQRCGSVIERMAGWSDDVDCKTISVIDS